VAPVAPLIGFPLSFHW
jgi:hypothetical protein